MGGLRLAELALAPAAAWAAAQGRDSRGPRLLPSVLGDAVGSRRDERQAVLGRLQQLQEGGGTGADEGSLLLPAAQVLVPWAASTCGG